jgi:hypothetical protein
VTALRLASISAALILALELADREPGVMSSTTFLAALVLKAPAEIRLSTADTMNLLVSTKNKIFLDDFFYICIFLSLRSIYD